MNDLQTTTPQETTLSVFSNEENFKNAMQMATQLSKSDMIPYIHRGIPWCRCGDICRRNRGCRYTSPGQRSSARQP